MIFRPTFVIHQHPQRRSVTSFRLWTIDSPFAIRIVQINLTGWYVTSMECQILTSWRFVLFLMTAYSICVLWDIGSGSDCCLTNGNLFQYGISKLKRKWVLGLLLNVVHTVAYLLCDSVGVSLFVAHWCLLGDPILLSDLHWWLQIHLLWFTAAKDTHFEIYPRFFRAIRSEVEMKLKCWWENCIAWGDESHTWLKLIVLHTRNL